MSVFNVTSRLASDVPALGLRRQLAAAGRERGNTLRHLASGVSVSRGADGPADLIAAETLDAQGRRLTTAVDNADAAVALADVLDAALGRITSDLHEIGRLVSANASGPPAEERAANQLEIDKLLEDIGRTIQTTRFKDRQVLRDLPRRVERAEPFDFRELTIDSDTVAGRDGAGGLPATATPSADGNSLRVRGNFWKTIRVEPFRLTPESRLSFTLNTIDPGEIIGVMLNANANTTLNSVPGASGSRYHLGGEATIGNWNFTHSQGTATGTRKLVIDLSAKAGSPIDRVHLVGDDDADGSTDLLFSNMRLYNDVPPPDEPHYASFQTAANVNATSDLELPGLTVASMGLDTVRLSELGSGGTHAAVHDNPTDAQLSVDAALRQVATHRARVAAFARHDVGATQRSQSTAALENAAALSTVRDTDLATATADLTRLTILEQAAPDLLAAQRREAGRVLGLLAG